jgi:hypothetical protein
MAFQRVTAVTPVDPLTYSANLSEDWCMGSGKLPTCRRRTLIDPVQLTDLSLIVPNGGYVSSILLTAVRAHFAGSLAHLDQPDTMSLQLQYLRRTQAGPAVITIEHLKLGRSTSTVQVVLSQGGRREVQGYVVQTNFSKQKGLTLPTSFVDTFMSSSPPPIDLAAVERDGEDANWRLERNPPHGKFRKAVHHILFHHPKRITDPSLVDQWIRFRPGGAGQSCVPFSQEALGFVADIFPHLIEQFPGSEEETRWYPTVALNLDIKRALPPGGANWLRVRVRAGEIRDGRIDLQVVVLDEAGNLVALSSHVSLVMTSERNMAGRRPGGDGKL